MIKKGVFIVPINLEGANGHYIIDPEKKTVELRIEGQSISTAEFEPAENRHAADEIERVEMCTKRNGITKRDTLSIRRIENVLFFYLIHMESKVDEGKEVVEKSVYVYRPDVQKLIDEGAFIGVEFENTTTINVWDRIVYPTDKEIKITWGSDNSNGSGWLPNEWYSIT